MSDTNTLCELVPVIRDINRFYLQSVNNLCLRSLELSMSLFSLTEEQAKAYAKLTPRQIELMVEENNVPLFSPINLPIDSVIAQNDFGTLGALSVLMRGKHGKQLHVV